MCALVHGLDEVRCDRVRHPGKSRGQRSRIEAPGILVPSAPAASGGKSGRGDGRGKAETYSPDGRRPQPSDPGGRTPRSSRESGARSTAPHEDAGVESHESGSHGTGVV
jgi:hypothetical protein